MSKNATSQKYVKSLYTLLDLFEVRHYKKAWDKLKLYIDKEYHLELYQENKNDIVIDIGEIRVIYNLDSKWDARQIHQKRKDQILKNSDNIEHYMFILSSPNTRSLYGDNALVPFVKDNKDKTAEIYFIDDLQFNILKHYLVPKHEVIHSSEEKEKIKKDYGVTSWLQFPLILSTDPVVRFIGGKVGDIIKITRNPSHIGKHILYRYCV